MGSERTENERTRALLRTDPEMFRDKKGYNKEVREMYETRGGCRHFIFFFLTGLSLRLFVCLSRREFARTLKRTNGNGTSSSSVHLCFVFYYSFVAFCFKSFFCYTLLRCASSGRSAGLAILKRNVRNYSDHE